MSSPVEVGRDLINPYTGEFVNADVRCPNDNEMVNVACWLCGWQRDPEQRENDLRAELAAYPFGRNHPLSHRRNVGHQE